MINLKYSLLISCLIIASCSHSQNSESVVSHVGGRCEGCEAALEYGSRLLTNTVTLPDYEQATEKLEISGTIYQQDGETPASDVILYVYHTDAKGIYPKKGNETGWGKRHGYIRGWLKTDESGRYTINTFRPASYPNTSIVAHIHATIKEEDLNPYYINDFLFDDDEHLSDRQRNNPNPRAGSGVLQTQKLGKTWLANRDIFLGKNIPNYPNK